MSTFFEKFDPISGVARPLNEASMSAPQYQTAPGTDPFLGDPNNPQLVAGQRPGWTPPPPTPPPISGGFHSYNEMIPGSPFYKPERDLIRPYVPSWLKPFYDDPWGEAGREIKRQVDRWKDNPPIGLDHNPYLESPMDKIKRRYPQAFPQEA